MLKRQEQNKDVFMAHYNIYCDLCVQRPIIAQSVQYDQSVKSTHGSSSTNEAQSQQAVCAVLWLE